MKKIILPIILSLALHTMTIAEQIIAGQIIAEQYLPNFDGLALADGLQFMPQLSLMIDNNTNGYIEHNLALDGSKTPQQIEQFYNVLLGNLGFTKEKNNQFRRGNNVIKLDFYQGNAMVKIQIFINN